MKKIGLVLLSLIVFAAIKDTYFYNDKGLPIHYICECSGPVRLCSLLFRFVKIIGRENND